MQNTDFIFGQAKAVDAGVFSLVYCIRWGLFAVAPNPAAGSAAFFAPGSSNVGAAFRLIKTKKDDP